MCTKPKASYRTVQYKYVYRYTPTGDQICFMHTVCRPSGTRKNQKYTLALSEPALNASFSLDQMNQENWTTSISTPLDLTTLHVFCVS